MKKEIIEYDYYKVHAKNKQGWKTVKVKKSDRYKCYSPFQLEAIIRR